MLWRRLIALLCLAAASARGSSAPGPLRRSFSPRILFVCQFGSAKSAIARELFRKRAAQRGINAFASSRGLTPTEHASAKLVAALKADGIDIDSDPLRKLEPADIETADLVILFAMPPVGLGLEIARDWTDLGSFDDDYLAATSEVQKRIDGLLDEIMTLKATEIRIVQR